MISAEELYVIRGVCAEHVGAHPLDVPGDQLISWLRSDAQRLAGGAFATAAEEAAALFYVLCSHDFQLGLVRIQFPIYATVDQIEQSGLRLTADDRLYLSHLQDEITENEMPWDAVLKWFEEHLQP
ncbi:hypothetical protein WME94_26320 [Sorangium sp. So ce429]